MRVFIPTLALSQALFSAFCLGNELPEEIIFGSEAEIGRYPYAVYFKISDKFCEEPLSTSTQNYFCRCGGSLLTPDTVLSSVGCVYPYFGAENFTAYVGGHDLTDLSSFEVSSVRDIIVDPDFDPDTNSNGAALFFLSEPVSVKDFIQINSNPEIPSFGDVVVTMGWGVTNLDYLNETSDVLKEADLFTITNEDCSLFYGFISETEFCGLGSIEGSCNGDFGGPVIIKGDDPSQDILVGVLLGNGNQCITTVPDVASRISSQYDWIVTTTCTNSSFIPDGFGCDDEPDMSSKADKKSKADKN